MLSRLSFLHKHTNRETYHKQTYIEKEKQKIKLNLQVKNIFSQIETWQTYLNLVYRFKQKFAALPAPQQHPKQESGSHG